MKVDNRPSIQEELKGSQIFNALKKEELDAVARLCRHETHEAGSNLFAEGDRAQKVYIIEGGRVALDMGLSFGGHTRRRATIETAGPGQAIGWSSLTGTGTFTMTARCLDETRVLAIDAAQARQLFDADSELGYRVMQGITEVVRSRLNKVREVLAYILSIASHDLKAPLHAVQSYHQVMLGGFAGPLTEKQKNMLFRSGERILGLLNLIDDILDVSRLDAGEIKKEKLNLAEAAQACIENVQTAALEKEIRLTCELPGKPCYTMGESTRLQQVVNNLLSNAVKFTPGGGQVSLHIKEQDDSILVEVSDTGIGIPSDDLPRIFDDFYRGKNALPGGAGLGLSIAKKIVEALGGRIWAESPYAESATGSRFTFTLPKTAAGGQD